METPMNPNTEAPAAKQPAVSDDERVDAILAEAAEKAAEKAAQEAVAQQKAAPESDAKEEELYTVRQFLGDAADLAESVITSIFVVMLVFTFLFCTANVDGDSMLPTLEDGDRLIVSRMDKTLETGDILILDSLHAYLFDGAGELYAAEGLGKNIVKRLIAQGGQEVNIDFEAGVVYVDGEALDEPYTSTLTTRDNRAFTYPFVVPEGYVFVLGDNRYVSKDSRHPEVGLVSEDEIVGRVLLRISPFPKFGTVE